MKEVFERVFDKKCIGSFDRSKEEQEIMDNVNKIIGKSSAEEYRKQWYFKNGYGISVVRGFGTYGVREGLFEIAVLKIQ
ncbi:MAG: hypothetical protein R6U11_08150 [Bacteroidales bacterium]